MIKLMTPKKQDSNSMSDATRAQEVKLVGYGLTMSIKLILPSPTIQYTWRD